MTFLFPPSFQTGGILSASKLNHLLTDIDTLYGWHYGPWYGCDQQQFDSTGTGTEVEGWAGWVLLTGDTLKVQLASFTGSVTAKVYFDDVQLGPVGGYTSAGVKTIALPIAANGWQPWTAYRVKVITYRPSGTGELDVTNVYLVNSTTPSAGTLPAFTDATQSDAADFNAISDGIRNVEPAFVQPVCGCRGGEEYITQGTNTGWTTVQSWSMQHRVNGLRCSLFLQGPNSTGTISARLRYNGTPVNGAEWSVNTFQSRRITDQIYAIPTTPPLTVGTFYTVDIQIKQSTGWLSGWHVRPDYVYEDQLGLPAGYYETLRWEHGDYAVGDSDNPGLYVMSENLNAINVNATACGAVNLVQREPIDTSAPFVYNWNRRFYHVRRWRWLAYNQHDWIHLDAEGNPLPAPSATVNWTYDGVTWDSYRLPELDGDEGGFYDLDMSPIEVGMTFYATGVRYAIQSPYPGYEP